MHFHSALHLLYFSLLQYLNGWGEGMNGLIKLTPESLYKLITECMDYMGDFDIEPYKKTEFRWSWSKFKKVKIDCYSGLPFWYQYKKSLERHFTELNQVYENAKIYNDEIWLSELSYKNMCLLKSGDRYANPIYIMNY